MQVQFCTPNELASTSFASLSGGTGFQALHIGYKFGYIFGYTVGSQLRHQISVPFSQGAISPILSSNFTTTSLMLSIIALGKKVLLKEMPAIR
jgi:hypothetical protein